MDLLQGDQQQKKETCGYPGCVVQTGLVFLRHMFQKMYYRLELLACLEKNTSDIGGCRSLKVGQAGWK